MPKYLQFEEARVRAAKARYKVALRKLQASCSHETILEFAPHEIYFRICEDCGLEEQCRWGKFTDWDQLGGRAYTVTLSELMETRPIVGERNGLHG